MHQSDKINVDGQDVIISSANLEFSEATLSEYLQKEGGYYNYFGAQLAYAEAELQDAELDYDVAYSKRFDEFKVNGSDNLAKAKAIAADDVVLAKKKANEAKKKVLLLKQHLRAWDKNHENVQSFGHMLRKEMDKLNRDIMWGQHSTMKPGEEDEIDKIVEHV